MRAEALNNVGKPVLSSGKVGTCNFSISKKQCSFRSSIQNNNKEVSLGSNIFTEYGSIISSIGDNKPLLIFRPYLGDTFLEISINCNDFLQLDTQFTQPLTFKQIPFKVHAECINNKSLLSIETTKLFSYSNFLKGLLFIKYGKSLDFNIDTYLPNFESHLAVDSSQILFNNSLGVHYSNFHAFPIAFSSLPPRLSSFFAVYKFSYDYIAAQHQVGFYIESSKKSDIVSVLYNLYQKEVNLKAETNFNTGLSMAASADAKLNFEKQEDQKRISLINFQIGTSFLLHDRFNSKCNLQFTLPSNEATAKLRTTLNQKFFVNASTTFNFNTKSFGLGIDITCDSDE